MAKKTIFWIVGIIVIGYVGCFAFGVCVVPKLLRNLFLFVGLCLIAIPCLNINYVIIYFITARILYGISFQLLFKKLGK